MPWGSGPSIPGWPIPTFCQQAPWECPASSDPSYQKVIRNHPTLWVGVISAPSCVCVVFLPKTALSSVTPPFSPPPPAHREERKPGHSSRNFVLNFLSKHHHTSRGIRFIDISGQNISSCWWLQKYNEGARSTNRLLMFTPLSPPRETQSVPSRPPAPPPCPAVWPRTQPLTPRESRQGRVWAAPPGSWGQRSGRVGACAIHPTPPGRTQKQMFPDFSWDTDHPRPPEEEGKEALWVPQPIPGEWRQVRMRVQRKENLVAPFSHALHLFRPDPQRSICIGKRNHERLWVAAGPQGGRPGEDPAGPAGGAAARRVPGV